MKDLRADVVNSIMCRLMEDLADDVLEKVQDTLTIELERVELIERTTEVSTLREDPEMILKRFVATKRIEGKAESTLKRYLYELRQLLDFLNKPLADITTNDLRFYLSYRRQNKKLKQLSNRTLDGMRRIYSSFFGWLAAEKIIMHDPTKALQAIKYKKTVRKPFTQVELQKLREACDSLRDLALIDWLYATGCRVSEVVNTDIVDVDFDALECIVTGKGNKERRVYMTPVCAMHIKQYLNSRTDLSPALFVGKGTDRLSKASIESILTKLGKAAGVENVHPHRFRRTLGSELYARGMPILDIAQILGHEDIGTTQIYCYVDPKAVKIGYQAKMSA